jgi:hypothetical protein
VRRSRVCICVAVTIFIMRLAPPSVVYSGGGTGLS